jgi:hypothetical protein
MYCEMIVFISDTDIEGSGDGAEAVPHVVFCSITLFSKDSSLLGYDHMFIGE